MAEFYPSNREGMRRKIRAQCSSDTSGELSKAAENSFYHVFDSGIYICCCTTINCLNLLVSIHTELIRFVHVVQHDCPAYLSVV